MNENLIQFTTLTTRKRALEAELKEIESQLEALEDAVRNDFAEAGITSVNTGTHTIYLARDIRARPLRGDDALAVAAFKANGEDWIVKETINRNTLASWVRDHMDKDGSVHDMPEEIKQAIEITAVYRVRARAK